MKQMVQLLIVREKDRHGKVLKMVMDDGKTVFEHIIRKDDKLKGLVMMLMFFLFHLILM